MDIVSINVCQFQLHIEPRQLIILPPYKGATLRGVFGNVFKDELAFSPTLLGKVIDYLPYFIYSFDELGSIGIGKGRGVYTLRTLLQRKTKSKGKFFDKT